MAARREAGQTGSEEMHTFLGKESTFEGKLVFNDGSVRIDGHLKGEVKTSSKLVVGESAKVEAKIEVGSIIIRGEVIGDITAKDSVGIEKPGRVRGTINTPELMIERGVVFDGTCNMDSKGSVSVLKPGPTSSQS